MLLNRATRRALSRSREHGRKSPPRPLGLHASVAAGIRRAEKARKADVIARPMRELFALLESGEVLELEGHAVMRMPEVDPACDDGAQWCAIAPALLGWIDCWARLAPDLSTYHMRILAERLDRGQDLTPRLVEKARVEFESTIARLVELPDGAIRSAVTTTQIAWEVERMAGDDQGKPGAEAGEARCSESA